MANPLKSDANRFLRPRCMAFTVIYAARSTKG
jgi:hypothetical protein